MVSRKHAVLKKLGDNWTIVDNNSLNGIYINGNKLTPGLPHTLEEGDVVQLGIPIASDKPAEFIWQFFRKLPVKKHMRVLSNNSQESLEADNDDIEVKRHCSHDSVLALKQKDTLSTVWSPGVNLRQKLDEQNRVMESRLQHEKERLNSLNGSTANASFDLKLQEEREQKLRTEQLLREQEEKLQRLQQELDDKRRIEAEAKVREEEMSRLQNELEMRAAAEEALREKQRQYEMELQKKAEAEEQLRKLQHELLEREEANRKMAAEINAREAEQKEYLEALQNELMAEKLASEERLRREYEQQIQVKEEELLQRLSDEKEQLNIERLAVEQSLQREMDKKLEDQNERLQQLLRDEQQRLARVIEQRDGQCRMLESALNQEVAKEKETALQAKEELLANFASLLEVEMQCSICSELFVKATSLSCSHSFCEFCLNQWLAVKKDCPVCRAPVTSRYRSVVLDNYIEKMVEHLSDDMKQKRRVIIDERRVEQERAAAKAAAKVINPLPEVIIIDPPQRNPDPPQRNPDPPQPRQRNNQRGGRNHQQHQQQAVPVAVRPAPPVAPARAVPRPPVAAPAARRAPAPAAGGQRVMRAPAPALPPVAQRLAGPARAPIPPVAAAATQDAVRPQPAAVQPQGQPQNMAALREAVIAAVTAATGVNPGEAAAGHGFLIAGDPNAYYPGFGVCYHCGLHGHWANGCPFQVGNR